MSNISRRKFLKGAGVAALAVAAAGVLTGCSGNDAPAVPGVTKKVTVIFMCNGATAGKDGSVVVNEDAKTVLVSQIKAEQIPQGYTVESTGELKIQEIGGKDHTTVIHAHEKIMASMITDENLKAQVIELRNILKNRG